MAPIRTLESGLSEESSWQRSNSQRRLWRQHNRKKQGKQFLPKLAEHGLIHHALDAAEALLGAIGNPKGTTTLGEMEDIGAWSVSLVTGCDANDLKKQLRKHHGGDPFNLEPSTRVRADPYGKRRDVPGASIMGKPSENNTALTI